MEKWSPLRVAIWMPSLLQDISTALFHRSLFLRVYHPSTENLREVCEAARNMKRLAVYELKRGILK